MTPDPLFSFQLPRGLLKAMALFQHEERAPIACASFEIRQTGNRHEITIVSTDGRRLATYQTEISQDTLWGVLPDHAQITVDLSGCARLPKVEGETGDLVTVEVFERHVEFAAGAIRYTARRLESGDGSVQFPNWRGVIPTRPPESVTQIAVNHELLADFGRAAKWIMPEDSSIALRTFGDGQPIAIILPAHREFFGILMPLKFADPATVPEWLRDMTASKSTATPAKEAA